MAIQAPPPLDLTGRPTGLEGLGQALYSLISAIKYDPKKAMFGEIMKDQQVAQAVSDSGYTILHDLEAQGKTPTDEDFTLGGGALPGSVVREVMKLHPERQRPTETRIAGEGMTTPQQEAQVATRQTRVGAAVEQQYPAAAEAKDLIAQAKEKGATAEYNFELAKSNLNVFKGLEAAGYDDEAKMTQQLLAQQLATANARIELKGAEQFVKIWEHASDEEKRMITLGIVGPNGQVFSQWLLQEHQASLQSDLARLQADLATRNADPLEIERKQFQLKTDILERRDKVVGLIDDAIHGNNGRKPSEVQTLVRELNDLGATLLRVDPAAAVETAKIVHRMWPRSDVVKFDYATLKDLVPAGAAGPDFVDQFEMYARTLAEAGTSQANIDALVKKTRDPRTGRDNPGYVFAIVQRATQIIDGIKPDSETNKEAAQTAQGYIDNPAKMKELEQKIKNMSDEFKAAFQGKGSDNVAWAKNIGEQANTLRFWKTVYFYAEHKGAAQPDIFGPGGQFGPSATTPSTPPGGGQ